tara:strand:- start:252 stop:383 length:132 start_codon:yes stop_codon:yes gene_type:complete
MEGAIKVAGTCTRHFMSGNPHSQRKKIEPGLLDDRFRCVQSAT